MLVEIFNGYFVDPTSVESVVVSFATNEITLYYKSGIPHAHRDNTGNVLGLALTATRIINVALEDAEKSR